MKLSIFFFAILSLTMLSCSKQSSVSPLSATLEGSWRMIAVKDNGSGSIITKPSSLQGDVDITFFAITNTSGTLCGHTPTNDISQSDYLTEVNYRLIIRLLDMTKVGETSWGYEFVENIRNSQEYNFESDNKLVIKTTNKTLTFERY